MTVKRRVPDAGAETENPPMSISEQVHDTLYRENHCCISNGPWRKLWERAATKKGPEQILQTSYQMLWRRPCPTLKAVLWFRGQLFYPLFLFCGTFKKKKKSQGWILDFLKCFLWILGEGRAGGLLWFVNLVTYADGSWAVTPASPPWDEPHRVLLQRPLQLRSVGDAEE